MTELPYAYHHEVINNSNSVVREPLKTNKTNQKKLFAPSNKSKTSVKQKPRLVKGTPSKSISNACNHCPNKVFNLFILKTILEIYQLNKEHDFIKSLINFMSIFVVKDQRRSCLGKV